LSPSGTLSPFRISIVSVSTTFHGLSQKWWNHRVGLLMRRSDSHACYKWADDMAQVAQLGHKQTSAGSKGGLRSVGDGMMTMVRRGSSAYIKGRQPNIMDVVRMWGISSRAVMAQYTNSVVRLTMDCQTYQRWYGHHEKPNTLVGLQKLVQATMDDTGNEKENSPWTQASRSSGNNSEHKSDSNKSDNKSGKGFPIPSRRTTTPALPRQGLSSEQKKSTTPTFLQNLGKTEH